jgi:DNA primase
LKKQSALKSLTTNLDQILEDLDIVVVNRGREISCKCPFHTDNHPSFSINADTGLWICYQCGRSGTLAMLLQKIGGVTDPEQAVRQIKRLRYQPPKRPIAEHIAKEEEKIFGSEDPYYLYAKYSMFSDVPDWALEDRNLSREAVQGFGIRWRKGWIIPIWSPRKTQDVTEDFWGWQFKRENEVNNYPPGIKKSQTLFGMNLLEGREAVLVESPLDVVRMSMVGIPAVASFGAMVSHYQVSLLEAKLDRLVLALDNDTAGNDQTEKIYPRIYRKIPTVMAVWGDEFKDPGDMSDEQLLEVFPCQLESITS